MSTRYYYSLGSEIYGGVAGLYDWGPPGCAIRKNVMSVWRDHFILEDDMLEISVTNITPESFSSLRVTSNVSQIFLLRLSSAIVLINYSQNGFKINSLKKKKNSKKKKKKT